MKSLLRKKAANLNGEHSLGFQKLTRVHSKLSRHGSGLSDGAEAFRAFSKNKQRLCQKTLMTIRKEIVIK